MTRLIALLVLLLAAWLGLAAPGQALGVPPSSVQTYTYDEHRLSTTTAASVAERGPPATGYDRDGTYDFVDYGSVGTSVRLDRTPARAGAKDTTTPTHSYDGTLHPVSVGTAGAMSQGRVAGTSGTVARSERLQVAAKSGTSLIGKSYGLGTVVENPGLAIKGFQGSKTPGHALNQIINRGVSPSMLRNTVANPNVVLRQGSGNYVHLSDEAAVVLRPDGQVVTAYGRADFRQHVLDILADVG